VSKNRAVASFTGKSKIGQRPPLRNTPVTAVRFTSEISTQPVYTAMAHSGGPIVMRRRPVPLPAVDVVRKERGRATRERNQASREADRRAVEAFWAAKRAVTASLAEACSRSPEKFRWTCDACGARYLESQLTNSRTHCCRVDARALSAEEAMRIRGENVSTRVCMKCGADCGPSAGRSQCCSFITKPMTRGELRRYRELLWRLRLEQVAANEVTP